MSDLPRSNAALVAMVAAMFASPAFAADYAQAPGSSLKFSGSYQEEAFTGRFPGFSTSLRFDPAQLAGSRLDVTIPIASATTDNQDYDDEMRGNAFFDSKKFPQARYTATTFRALGGNRFAADGTLSLHGVSKPVTLTFTWTPGAKPVLDGKATVKRLDFGIGGGEWNDTSLIANDVVVTTKVVFAPKVAAAAAAPAAKPAAKAK
ncbi:YceI family protein [Lysobacter sp. KIS68-7]|uniref:YceI family protein n=1 Tax=Lysobacter sp. KIS68-7 TaxID=2904252 RepID=UPI001E49B3FF|nr:YceI family protein [Lysobacter sp. KIS68-7]UHQ19721.1 YceI family protein [Lysobacter sp. KIS68-7]